MSAFSISAICLLLSVDLALLSLETFGAPLNIKLEASLRMQLLSWQRSFCNMDNPSPLLSGLSRDEKSLLKA